MRNWLQSYIKAAHRRSYDGVLIPILMIIPLGVVVVFAGIVWPPLARKWDRFIEETLGKVE